MNKVKKLLKKIRFVTYLNDLRIYYQCLLFPEYMAKRIYIGMCKRIPNFKNPKDINEKINYQKFHYDMKKWANLADKYLVREYVRDRGLENILIPLIAKYYSPEDFINDFDNLPEQFIIKNNNGCGDNIVVKNRDEINKSTLLSQIRAWYKVGRFGVLTVEPHYTLIDETMILVEEFLVNTECSINSISKSLIDYKVWCFNSKPYCIFVGYNRNISDGSATFDLYDTSWNRMNKYMVEANPEHAVSSIELPKPQNLDYMLECASILSNGNPQARVDFYNINGHIYFGEMTMTSQGGYMNYLTQEFLLKMGQQFEV